MMCEAILGTGLLHCVSLIITTYNYSLKLIFGLCFIYYTGATVFEILCTLLATEIIIYYIRKYIMKRVSKAVLAEIDIISGLGEVNYQKFNSALEFCKSTNKKHPSLYARLELGKSWDDVVMKIIATCHL